MSKTIEFPILSSKLLETDNLDDPKAIGQDMSETVTFTRDDFDPTKHDRNRETLKLLTDILDDEQITYWLTADTLLGAFRHGDLIPWTKHAQISVLLEDHGRLFSEQFKSKADQSNLSVEAGFYPVGENYDSVTNYVENYLDLDNDHESLLSNGEFETTGFVSTIRCDDAKVNVFSRIPIQCGEATLYSEAFGQTLMTEQDIFPLKTGKLGSHNFYCPAFTKKILARRYDTLQVTDTADTDGQDWQRGIRHAGDLFDPSRYDADEPNLSCDRYGNYTVGNIPIGSFRRFRRIRISGDREQRRAASTEAKTLRVHLKGDHTIDLECADDDPGKSALSDVLAGNAIDDRAQRSGLVEIKALGSNGNHSVKFLGSDLVAITVGPALASFRSQDPRPETKHDQEDMRRAGQENTKAATTLPVPYARIPDFLTEDELNYILSFALQSEAAFTESTVTDANEEYRKSKVLFELGDVKELFEQKLKTILDRVYGYLMTEMPNNFSLETQLTASNDGDYFKMHDDKSSFTTSTRLLTYVYYFHADPKGFTGGDLKLYDYYQDKDVDKTAVETFATIVPDNNTIVLFPSWVVHEVMPIDCPSGKFADSRFTLNGWLHEIK